MTCEPDTVALSTVLACARPPMVVSTAKLASVRSRADKSSVKLSTTVRSARLTDMPAEPIPGAVLSSVNSKAADAAPVLPAASVWRTCTDFSPLPVSVRLLPEPVIQLLPPLVLYCQLAPGSSPATLTTPLVVMPSLALEPVSLAKVGTGDAGAVVSRVTLSAADASLTLPAASVWRTRTVLGPSPLSVRLLPDPALQLLPPLLLYSQEPPASSPLTLITPLLVTRSEPLLPLSAARANVGVATTVSRAKLSAIEAELVLPAESVATALTLMAPSPSRASSSASSTTA